MNKIETKSTVLLKHHLKTLKMPTMHSECEMSNPNRNVRYLAPIEMSAGRRQG